ncbi:YVTN repeat-like/Quino protein amine dehydrogenase [Trametes sanguinea]|nr:YVTN repeat-like/Quino protein amine dehydrogenase [Trametes sanguinea]
MSAFYAWDVYASSLIPLGKGYPLWMPDPERPEWEVEVGDVGYISDGSFQHLLRTTNSEAEPQPHGIVPEDYVQFRYPNTVVSGPRESITQPVLHSRAIRKLEVSSAGSVNIPMGVAAPSANIKFKCTEDKGALLLLSPKGEDTIIRSRIHVVDHLRENIDKWERMANDMLGLDLRQEDIYFVCGVTKTSRWAVAAFHGSERDAEGSISCDLTALASASFSMRILNLDMPNCMYRVGPPEARGNSQLSTSSGQSSYEYHRPPSLAVPPSGVVPDKADQCIFFHYYKIKKRFWVFPRIEAGAGPHQLPSNDPRMGGHSAILADEGEFSSFEYDGFELPNYPKPYDPVNVVLDYILENSEAHVALASDLDLYALFKTPEDFPEDVAGALARLHPAIHIDEHNVGILVVESTSPSQRKREQEEPEPEATSSKKPALAPTPPPVGGEDRLELTDDRDAIDRPTLGQSVDPVPPAYAVALRDDLPIEAGDQESLSIALQGNIASHEGPVTALAYSDNSSLLASGSENSSIILWDTRAMIAKWKVTGRDGPVTALAFSPDGKRLASAAGHGVIKIWTVDEPLKDEPISLDALGPVLALTFTPDGSQLIAGATGDRLIIWRVDDPQDRIVKSPLSNATSATKPITFITFSSDGRLMATGGAGLFCYIWQVNKLSEQRSKAVLGGRGDTVSAASFSHNGSRIATVLDNNTCKIWNAETREEICCLGAHIGFVWSARFSPDDKYVVSVSQDGGIQVYDLQTDMLQPKELLAGRDTAVNQVEVAYSPDGRFIVAASDDGTMCVWNADWTCLEMRTGDRGTGNMLFSPDGTTLAYGWPDGRVMMRTLPREKDLRNQW